MTVRYVQKLVAIEEAVLKVANADRMAVAVAEEAVASVPTAVKEELEKEKEKEEVDLVHLVLKVDLAVAEEVKVEAVREEEVKVEAAEKVDRDVDKIDWS